MVVVRNIMVEPIAGRPTCVRAWPNPSRGVIGDAGLVAGVEVGGASMPKRVTVTVSVTVRGIVCVVCCALCIFVCIRVLMFGLVAILQG